MAHPDPFKKKKRVFQEKKKNPERKREDWLPKHGSLAQLAPWGTGPSGVSHNGSIKTLLSDCRLGLLRTGAGLQVEGRT